MVENQETAGARGLVRDESGTWKGGFATRLRCKSIEEVKARALLFGFRMAWEMGCRKIIMELDSLSVYN